MLRFCLILKVRDFRENSLIVSVLHPQLGKQEFLAKGAKNVGSKLAPWLLPLHLVHLWTTSRKAGLPIIREVKTVSIYLPSQYLSLKLALRIASLLDDIVYPAIESQIFMREVLSVLISLKRRKYSLHELKKIWITFELHVLAYLGVAPSTQALQGKSSSQVAFSLERKIYQFLSL